MVRRDWRVLRFCAVSGGCEAVWDEELNESELESESEAEISSLLSDEAGRLGLGFKEMEALLAVDEITEGPELDVASLAERGAEEEELEELETNEELSDSVSPQRPSVPRRDGWM